MNRLALRKLFGGIMALGALALGTHVSAQTVTPGFQKWFSIKRLGTISGSPTQMAWGPDGRLYVMTADSGVHSFAYDKKTGLLTDEKTAVRNVFGIGIAFHSYTLFDNTGTPYTQTDMYVSTGGGSILRLRDENKNGVWGERNETNFPIVYGVPVGDHTLDQIQIKGDTLYIGIGRRTINGHKGEQTSGSFSDVYPYAGFWSGGNGYTWGDCAYGGTISWIQNLRKVPDQIGFSNVYFNTFPSQYLIQGDTSPYSTQYPQGLYVHSAGTRNPFGLALDKNGQLFFTNNFNRTNTNGDGTAGFGFPQDSLGPDFSLMVHDQVFKAEPNADYGYTDENWRGVAAMMTPGTPGYKRVKSLTFDNLFNKGPYTIHDPDNPDGLGPCASADGIDFFYAPGLPDWISRCAFVTRWNSTITENISEGRSITYADIVAVDPTDGRVRRVAKDFANPLALLWDKSRRLIVADYGTDTFYALTSVLTPKIRPNTAQGRAGQTVNVSARLYDPVSGSGVEGKTLTFTVGTAAAQTGVTGANGIASIAYTIDSATTPGNIAYTVNADADDDINAATATGNVTVNLTPTEVLVPNREAQLGKVGGLFARVRMAGAIPLAGKTVTYKIGETVLGTAITDANGFASLAYTPTEATGTGDVTLKVSFTGSGSLADSTGSGTLSIAKADMQVALADRQGHAKSRINFRGRLRRMDAVGVSGLTLLFKVNGSIIGSGTTDATGAVLFQAKLPNLAPGDYTLTAEFPGNALYNGVTNTGTLTILP